MYIYISIDQIMKEAKKKNKNVFLVIDNSNNSKQYNALFFLNEMPEKKFILQSSPVQTVINITHNTHIYSILTSQKKENGKEFVEFVVFSNFF